MQAAPQMPQNTSELDEFTFLIPEPNVPKFRKKLTALNKRAQKLGLNGLASADLGEVVKTSRHVGRGGVETVVKYHYRKILVTGERPKLNGWKLLGTIAHEAGGNIFSNAPGEEIPESYRDKPNVCDHCKTERKRRDTMIIEKDGEVRQIGRNCLQDFVGDVNVKGVTFYYELWPSLQGHVGGLASGASKDYVPVIDYMAAVACAIRHYGFVSKTAAASREDLTPTSSDAWIILFPPPRRRDDDPIPAIMAEDHDAAHDIVSWIENDLAQRNDNNSYLRNLVAACSGGWLRHKFSGLAASAFRARENDVRGKEETERRRREAEDRKKKWEEERANDKNEFFGEVKKRDTWVLKVIKLAEYESDWGGYYTSVTLKDPDGRMCKFTTSSSTEIDKLEKGKTFLIKGTVKKHETWSNDVKCTYLNRVKVEGVAVEEDKT